MKLKADRAFQLHQRMILSSMSIILLGSSEHTQGAVTIAPSGTILSVCNGDHLVQEFTCMITDSGHWSFSILVWNVTLISDDETTPPMIYTRAISSSSPSDQRAQIVVTSTSLTFSRISPQNSFPFVSRLLISFVSSRTEVNCLNDLTLESSSTTVVNITSGHPIQDTGAINLMETVKNDHILMTLEWTRNDLTYSFHITVIPPTPQVNYSTSTQIKVPYNVAYNVSILVSSCGQYNVTAFFKELFYASTNCRNPAGLLTDHVTIVGFIEPAVIESSVDFSCPPRMMLSGPNTSICMGNGEWEPDLRAVNCTANCGPPSPPTNAHILPFTNTLEGATVTYVCCGIHSERHQFCCDEDNVTAVCNRDGHWEPSTDDICAGPTDQSGALLSEDGRIAVASSLITSIVSSVLFFAFGYFCHHCQQKPKQTSSIPSPVRSTVPVYEKVTLEQDTEQDLELKENVAYGPLTTNNS